MKSISLKALITLLVITMTICASLNRETKSKTVTKTETKTKSDGSGNWSDGYSAPRIDITPVAGGAKVSTGQWTFKPANMNSVWRDGFEVEGINLAAAPYNAAPFNQIFVQNAAGGSVYIPWRWIDSNDIESGKWTLSNKFVTFKLTNDANTTYHITLVMPWAVWSTYITMKQVTDLVTGMVTRSTDAQNAIIKSKTSLKTNVQELAVQLENKKKSQADAAKIKNDAKAANELIMTSLKNKGQQLNVIKIQIAAKTNELSTLINQRDTLNSETTKIANEIEGDTVLLNAEERAKAVANAAKQITQLKKDITHEINHIKEQASDDYCVQAADQAQVAAFALDSGALITAFKKIYSWNEARP